jgi:hypothetical protein
MYLVHRHQSVTSLTDPLVSSSDIIDNLAELDARVITTVFVMHHQKYPSSNAFGERRLGDALKIK